MLVVRPPRGTASNAGKSSVEWHGYPLTRAYRVRLVKMFVLATVALQACSAPSLPSDLPGEPHVVPISVESPSQPSPSLMSDLTVPLYALVSTGQESARLLWVPWPGTVEYGLERRIPGAVSWSTIDAEVSHDSAVVSGLSDGDEVRVAAFDAEGNRIGESVALEFTPASEGATEIGGHRILDGRGEGWTVVGSMVLGTAEAPRQGDLLLLPLSAGVTEPVREVETVSMSTDGWAAHTRPPTAQPPGSGGPAGPSTPADHGAVVLNASLEGVVASVLDSSGRYCSESGWGCIDFPIAPLALEEPAGLDRSASATPWFPLQRTLSYGPIGDNGLTLGASASGGVELRLVHDLSYLPPGVDRLTAQARPYASANATATMVDANSNAEIEHLVYDGVSIVVFSLSVATVFADFDVSAVADLDTPNAAVNGQWTANADYSRIYEVGYRDDIPGSGFYGPQLVDESWSLGLTPEFGDGSEADLWFGFRADVTLEVDALWSLGTLASGTLSATVGPVLTHSSTPAAPCGRTESVAAARVDAGAKLDATLDLIFLNPWEFPALAEQREPLLTWGRERTLVVPRVSQNAPVLPFRIRALGPPPPATGLPHRDVDLDNPSDLTVFLDQAPQPPPSIDGGRYVLSPATSLFAGTSTLAVWLPDLDHGSGLQFGAAGQCLTAPVAIEAAP